jgi:hypothetical protein
MTRATRVIVLVGSRVTPVLEQIKPGANKGR